MPAGEKQVSYYFKYPYARNSAERVGYHIIYIEAAANSPVLLYKFNGQPVSGRNHY